MAKEPKHLEGCYILSEGGPCSCGATPTRGKSMENGWVPVAEWLPVPKTPVLAWVMYRTTGRVLRAMYVPKLTVGGSNEEAMDMDHSEGSDQYFLPEGWYEWNDFDECHWRIVDEVTHWRMMPNGPAT